MKTLYMIGGPMGVGKTEVCRLLKRKLDRSVFLDGDNCWDADPFIVNDETKLMVESNICFLLNSFIRCSEYENIIFCWVMHEQRIIDDISSHLELSKCDVKRISLTCSPEELRERLEKDIESGKRQPDVIERSLERLPIYASLDTFKIDTTGIAPEDVARQIAEVKIRRQ